MTGLGKYSADLHVHSCLSPCAELEMSPQRIAQRAAEIGLDLIAVCDHNSAENAAAVQQACERQGLTAIAGMEISTMEEIHVLGLFPTVQDATAVQQVVFANLPGENDEALFGRQVIASADDYVEGFCPRLLIGATTLALEQVVDLIHAHGGLAIAAHIDRQSYSLLSQLGFVPVGIELDALEISASGDSDGFKVPGDGRWNLVTGSDAHRLAEIGRARTEFTSVDISFSEVGKALRGEDGRRADAVRA